MKKGLNVTLMTVAFAMLCMQAMAMAPVISEIQSPVIGNEPGVTAATPYYWKDAIDLDANVSDETPDADIQWSYYIAGTPIYRLGDVDSLTLAEAGNETDTATPPFTVTTKRLNGTTKDPQDGDGLSKTVTIRNVKYAPLPVGTTGQTPAGTGLIDSQVVTLFASDGTTYSSKDIMFYTEVGGTDHFGTDAVGTDVPLPVLPTGWTFNASSTFGTVTSAIVGSSICMSTPLAGLNFNADGWKSNFGFIPLVQNAVYRMRFKVTFAPSGTATCPFWDIVINNYTGSAGLNLYGGDFYFLDNEGSANAPTSAGKDFFVWWSPSPLTTPQWNNATNGVFATSVGNNKNALLQFRVLDVNSNGGITADVDAGQICMTEIQMSRWDLSQMTVGDNVYASPATMSASNYNVVPLFGSTKTYSGNGVTVDNVTEKASEFIQTYPGDATLDYGNLTSLTDNFPITWESNTLYMVTAELSAPTADDEAHPYDVFWLAMDSATNEIITESYVTTKQNLCGMPKVAGSSPQVYRSFFWSHTLTNSTVNEFKRLRPKINIGSNTDLVDVTNSGAMKIANVKVDKVSFPGGAQ